MSQAVLRDVKLPEVFVDGDKAQGCCLQSI